MAWTSAAKQDRQGPGPVRGRTSRAATFGLPPHGVGLVGDQGVREVGSPYPGQLPASLSSSSR